MSHTTYGVKHTMVDERLDNELRTIGLRVEMTNQYASILVEYVSKLFENLEMECWSYQTSSIKPLLTSAVETL